jgi:hypothetical protein
MVMRWLTLALVITLIVVHGFWPDVFAVDAITIVLLFILCIPLVAQYLRKAKFPGAEFEFKDEIRETERLVKLSIEQAEESSVAGERKILPFETFKLSGVRELLDSDPVLALASLRIEIERKLNLFVELFSLGKPNRWPISRLIEAIKKRDLLSVEQVTALQKIVNMCNRAVHGSLISVEEAKEIIGLAEDLNKTFSIGYSIDFSPNLEYNKHGLLCEWEHCIEWMPLTSELTNLSCPVFGHNCPGGIEKVTRCDNSIDDLPPKRFVKK